MKRFLKLGIPVLSLTLLLTGCGNTKTLECSMKDDSNDGMVLNQKVKVSFDGDNVTKVDMDMKMTVDEEYSDYMDMMEDSLKEQFEDIESKKGITLKTSTKGNDINISFVADLTKMDKDTKEELDIVDTEASYDEAKKTFEDEGYSCK